MSSEERMLKLMAYADGELEGADLAEVEAWLAEDAEAVRFANEVAGLGDLIRIGRKDSPQAKAVARFDIVDAVMAEVAKAGPVEALEERERVGSSRGEGPRMRTRVEETGAEKSNLSSLDVARARKAKSARVGAAVAAALALAASVFLMSRAKNEQPMAESPIQVGEQAQSVAAAGPGVDVDVDETRGHSVSVFYIPNESMTTTTTSVVVWVDESGGE